MANYEARSKIASEISDLVPLIERSHNLTEYKELHVAWLKFREIVIDNEKAQDEGVKRLIDKITDNLTVHDNERFIMFIKTQVSAMEEFKINDDMFKIMKKIVIECDELALAK